MEKAELYLRTLFCCMACDGEIAPVEIDAIKHIAMKSEAMKGLDIQVVLNDYVSDINKEGRLFLRKYLNELGEAGLSQEEEMNVVDLAIEIIESDQNIEYAEVKFFKKIRAKLSLSDDQILANHPDKEDFLLPDIHVSEDVEWGDIVFDEIKFVEFEKK
ncbi:MAG: TerB family tellurite resistance protein [Prevotella sp.]|nr:TerB family tellurite resistance protein [Prevotella sp.]